MKTQLTLLSEAILPVHSCAVCDVNVHHSSHGSYKCHRIDSAIQKKEADGTENILYRTIKDQQRDLLHHREPQKARLHHFG